MEEVQEEDVIIEEVPKEATETTTAGAVTSRGFGANKALDLLEEEKKKMSPLEQLERSLLWKVEGNEFFKKGELFKAADCYYHSIVFARDLTKNPQHYPELKHTHQEMTKAKDREHLKQLKREEREGEKREFSFASTLSGMGFKEKDLLGDGSVRKQQVSAGDGGKWLNKDWLDWSSPTKCVIHIAVSSVEEGHSVPVGALSDASQL
eukprot:g906.t1